MCNLIGLNLRKIWTAKVYLTDLFTQTVSNTLNGPLPPTDFSNDKVYAQWSNYNWVVMFHVWGLLICWTFVVDVLILWGRYAKSTKYYYEVHSWGMMAMTVVSLTATV
jgi:hypothetical protein